MFDIADNALKIPFMKCAHSRNVKYFYGAVADNMLVLCYILSQARPTFARERKGLVNCIYKLCPATPYGVV